MSFPAPLMASHSPGVSAFGKVRLSFDAGTVVVEGAHESWCHDVSGLLWDARIGAFRAPGHRYAQVRTAFERRGIPFEDALATEPFASIRVRTPDLRPYQKEALLAWEMAGCRGLLALPTGSGKTMIGIAALHRIARAALVLVPTRALLEQWVSVLHQFCDGPVGVLGDGSRTVHDLTVATFESAYRHMDSFGRRFALVLVDEAHHFSGGARVEALEMCVAPARLGLTATPPEQGAASDRLASLIGPVVFELTIGDLSGRHLAPYDHVRLFVDLTPGEQLAYDRERSYFEEAYRVFCRQGGGLEWRDFVKVAVATHAGRRALRGFHESRRIVASATGKLELLVSLLARHAVEPCIIFTADNTAAYSISRELLVPAVTCDIARDERACVLDRIRRGELRVLVSARVLNEGIDLPALSVGIVTGGTLGKREHVQRVGRLLRPGPGKRARLYELVTRNTFEVAQARRRSLALVSRTAP